MEEFSFNALTALLWANKLITGLVISTLLAAILIQAYWDKVGYFVMRVWHGVPLIGKVARLSKQSLMLDSTAGRNRKANCATRTTRAMKRSAPKTWISSIK